MSRRLENKEVRLRLRGEIERKKSNLEEFRYQFRSEGSIKSEFEWMKI